MNNILKRKIILLVLIIIVSLPFSSSLAVKDNTSTTAIYNPIKATTVDGFIKDFLIGVIKIGIPVVALAIIYSGFLFVFARGNTEKLGTAKKALTYSLIGAAILLGSWAIAQLISDTVLAL